MKVLWAPWRGEYLTAERKGGCIFCEETVEKNDEKNYIFYRGRLVFGILNRFPYNSGHLMIAPYRHVANIQDLEVEEWTGMLELLKDSVRALDDFMHPHGYNIGFNAGGAAAGGGFEHLHMHVVPRWSGDTNFMPVLADTKVISEHMDNTYKKLSERLNGPQP
jgi:ATP adenylyltransferase